MNAKRILIIDDDLINFATLSQILLQNGYNVDHAMDQNEALKKVKKSRPDMIICKAYSDTRDANEMMIRMHELSEIVRVPFLFVAENDAITESEPKILGPARILKKPFTREQVARAIQENLKVE